MKCKCIKGVNDLDIFYVGPDLDEGALPAVFYFTSTGEQALLEDPFNQPVLEWSKQRMRVFSMTLPFHGNVKNSEVIPHWQDDIIKAGSAIHSFVKDVISNIHYLISKDWINSNQFAVAGLSRGAFIAALVAMNEPLVDILCGFAPLIKLDYLDEFKSVPKEILKPFDFENYIDRFTTKKIKFYIGNHDIRVGTEASFNFLKSVVDRAYENKVRSPEIEFMMFPSIGHRGHGTPPYIFKDGAEWVISKIVNTQG